MARILVVEDDPAQRFLFVQILRRAGYDALGAEDAQATYDTLTSGVPIDAVLLDMVLPGLDGLAVRRYIQQHYPHLPIVMMSVRAARDWNLNPNQSGVYFLQKPFERDTLSRILIQAMSDVRRGAIS